MCHPPVEELTAHQRAIRIKQLLDAGERLTMAEIARQCGLTINGAKYMMAMISVMEPYAEKDGLWQRISGR